MTHFETLLRDNKKRQVYEQAQDQVGRQVSDQVYWRVRDQVSDQVYWQVRDHVQVQGQVWDQVHEELNDTF